MCYMQSKLLLVVLQILLPVLQTTNVYIAKNRLTFKEVYAITHVLLVQSQIQKILNALHVMPHARLVSTIQALAQVVNQEKDTFSLLEISPVVSSNALKELSRKTVFAKFATLNVLNVLVQLQIVSHVQSIHSCTTEHAGITVQASCQMECASILALQVTTKSTIENVSNATLSAAHVNQTPHALFAPTVSCP